MDATHEAPKRESFEPSAPGPKFVTEQCLGSHKGLFRRTQLQLVSDLHKHATHDARRSVRLGRELRVNRCVFTHHSWHRSLQSGDD